MGNSVVLALEDQQMITSILEDKYVPGAAMLPITAFVQKIQLGAPVDTITGHRMKVDF